MDINKLVIITVPGVDLKLLRSQRDTLLTMEGRNDREQDTIDGMINLCDAMLDITEK